MGKVTDTGSIDTSISTGHGDATAAFPDSSRGVPDDQPRNVRAQYEALVAATAPGAKFDKILSVSLANDMVKVEYVDESAATAFDPTPIRVVTATIRDQK